MWLNKYTSWFCLCYLIIASACIASALHYYGQKVIISSPEIYSLNRLILVTKMPIVEGRASWIGYNLIDSCAARDWPKGSILRVKNAGTEEPSIVCVVRDFGPDYSVFPDRIIDLNYKQFQQLANPEVGIIEVEVELTN